MNTPEHDQPEQRRYRWRYGPLRLAAPPCLAIAGVLGVVRGASGLSDPGDSLALPLLIFGVAAVAIGIGAIFLFRWMAKRGI